MLGAAAWRHGGLASSPRTVLHSCLRTLGRCSVVEASAQQQRQQQQRQRQRRRAGLLSEPTVAPDATAPPRQQQHANLQPPARSMQQQQQQQQRVQVQQHGAIELVVGPMFAGKTTELLRRVAQCEAAGLSVAVVKSSKDNRYCAASVVTHNGLKRVRTGALLCSMPASGVHPACFPCQRGLQSGVGLG